MSAQLKIPCLGRPFNLGMLYDCHSEMLIPGKSLWDWKVLKSALQTTVQPSSRFEIITEDTIQKKSSSLDIDANLKLSLMGGLVEVEGAAKFLDDEKSSEQQARVTLKYSSTTRFEQLTMEQLGAIQYPQVLDDHHATHVVTGVTYGSDAFFVFDRSVRTSEKLRDVHGNMEAKIRWIPIKGSASLDIKEKDKTETNNFRCKFYGDIILPSNPSTFDEAVKVYKELPQLLNDDTCDKSVPKIVYLYPLSELDGKPQQIVRWITSDLIAQVEEIMECFHRIEMRGHDLMKHDVCPKFADIENQISTFLSLVKRFKISFVKDIAVLLPKIRSKGAEEQELAELISSVHKSPFNSKEMDKYFRGKDREIKFLAQYIKNISKEPKVQFAFPDTDCSLITLTTDDEIEHVICFAFNVTSDTSAYIKNLELYLQQCTWNNESKAVKEWFEKPDVSKKLRQVTNNFTEFVTANSNSENMAFVIIDRNEETEASGPAIICYTNGVPMDFEPPGKPGKPKANNIGRDSIDLEWTAPVRGADVVISYNVLYHLTEDSKPWCIATTDAETSIQIKDLSPGTKYHFQVQAVSEPGVSAESDSYSAITKHGTRLADSIKKQSKQIKTGQPAIYQLPLLQEHANTLDGLYKYVVGSPNPNSVLPKPEKVLMVLGATGAGKSTLLNGIANYVLGVTWKDSFRFKVITDEGTSSQAKSQTKNITAYTFHRTNLPFILTIIDTPGFGDTGGIENDKRIAAQIKTFFSGRNRGGIDQLHGIGFVTQASLARLTPTQRYIFDAILSIFGKDIIDNIFLLTTFADAIEPPVLAATKAAKIPYKESFKFNNSALFASNESGVGFNSMFWEMGCTSFKEFFQHFSAAESRSLALTREVLQEREQIENLVPGLHEQINYGLSQLHVIQQEEGILKRHEDDIAASKDFTYEVTVPKFDKIPLTDNTYTTTCLKCNFTCHNDCAYSNDTDKSRCCAMNAKGCCTVCPDKCSWSQHRNLPYLIKHSSVIVTRTSDDLKKRYESAKDGKEKLKEMMDKKEEALLDLQAQVFSLIEAVRQSTNRLSEIALKPNPLTEIDYLDLLIEAEKIEANPGWKERVAQFMKIRKEAEMLKSVPKISTQKSKGKSWWQSITNYF